MRPLFLVPWHLTACFIAKWPISWSWIWHQEMALIVDKQLLDCHAGEYQQLAIVKILQNEYLCIVIWILSTHGEIVLNFTIYCKDKSPNHCYNDLGTWYPNKDDISEILLHLIEKVLVFPAEIRHKWLTLTHWLGIVCSGEFFAFPDSFLFLYYPGTALVTTRSFQFARLFQGREMILGPVVSKST